jgi:hypothetical protein
MKSFGFFIFSFVGGWNLLVGGLGRVCGWWEDPIGEGLWMVSRGCGWCRGGGGEERVGAA